MALMNVVRFESTNYDLNGFWSPVSSSIDWCERNYVISWYIAEYWNALSSFIILLTALAGVLQVQRRHLEFRFGLFHGSIILVGLGSVAFHGTLNYFGQMGDELPMIWTMLIWWYIMFQMEDNLLNTWSFTPIILFIYGGLFSIVHYTFAFTVVFQLHSALLIGIGFFHVFRYS